MDLRNGTEKKSYKDVFTIVDRGENRRPIWLKIGAAFVNQDSSLTVKLDGLPTNGSLHIRDHSDPPWEKNGRGRELDFGAQGDAS